MLSKSEVIAPLHALRRDEVVITSMSIVRAWGQLSRHPLDFAAADSAMGHTADFALGVALAQPGRRVVCLTGDGSLLMSLGTLVTIAGSGCNNLLLIVLVNGGYEITGNQPLPAARMNFAALARAAGISQTAHYECAADYTRALPRYLAGSDSAVLSLAVEPGDEPPLRRGPAEPATYLKPSLAEATDRLRQALTAPGEARKHSR